MSPPGPKVGMNDAGERANPRCGPGDETSLEVYRGEGGGDVAEVIVRWRTVKERSEPPEAFTFLATDPGDLTVGVGPGQ
jgi:hypothetical protein